MTEVLNQTPVLFNVNGNTIIDTNLLFLFNRSNFRNEYKKEFSKQLLESETQCSKINIDLRQIPLIYGKYF